MKRVLYMFLLVAFVAGFHDVQAQSRKKKVSSSKTKAKAKSSKRAPQRKVSAPKNMLSLLQGRWQSLDDEKTYFVVEGDKQINYYGNDALDTTTLNFHKEYPVKISGSDPKLTSGTYMTAAMKPNDYLIYSVESIGPTRLILLYLPRGNALRYKKVAK